MKGLFCLIGLFLLIGCAGDIEETANETITEETIKTKNDTVNVMSNIQPKPEMSLEAKKEAQDIMDYVNELRLENGKGRIGFDERAYNIGMARIADMKEYDYLDHTNPETGSHPDGIKTEYGLSGREYVAENIYRIWGASANPKEAIGGWMTSAGHKYNLLYTGHTAGAVVCDGGFCVFLGLNRDRFGKGSYTAAEGKAFWDSYGRIKRAGDTSTPGSRIKRAGDINLVSASRHTIKRAGDISSGSSKIKRAGTSPSGSRIKRSGDTSPSGSKIKRARDTTPSSSRIKR